MVAYTTMDQTRMGSLALQEWLSYGPLGHYILPNQVVLIQTRAVLADSAVGTEDH